MDQTTMDDVSGALLPISPETTRLQIEHWPNEVFVTQEGRVVRLHADNFGLSMTIGESKPLVFTPAQTAALSQFFRGL